MHINKEDISVNFMGEGSLLIFEAIWHGCGVGYVWCSRDQNRLKVSDFKVDDKFPIRWPFMHNLLLTLGVPTLKKSFRGMGIGTLLINRVLEEAKKTGIQEIWGSVVQSDIDRNPNLLQWYKRRGFILLEPDGECLDGARHKITWKSE